MFKYNVLVMLVIIAVSCDALETAIDESSARKKHYHGLHHHGLYHYWIFLAIKAKIIFLIGTFLSFWLFAGKAFAFLYYVQSNKDKCQCPTYHSPIITEEPHFDHKYSTIFNSDPPIGYPGFNGKPPFVSTYERYSRSMENSVTENVDILKEIIKKVDVTELAFSSMNLKKKSCKKRFICEANQQAKSNPLFALSLYMLSDTSLIKYSTNQTINSSEDCELFGPNCAL